MHYYNENTGQVVERDGRDAELDSFDNWFEVADADEARGWGPKLETGILHRPGMVPRAAYVEVPIGAPAPADRDEELQKLRAEVAELKQRIDNPKDVDPAEQSTSEQGVTEQATGEKRDNVASSTSGEADTDASSAGESKPTARRTGRHGAN